MTTELIIILIFCAVDDGLGVVAKERNAKLYPSEVITIGILFALKGGRFRAYYRWLKRDYDGLFAGLPERTALQKQRRRHEHRADQLLADPSLLNVIDSFPIELLFPICEGRSAHQIGTKNKDKGRWSIGVKRCWILNRLGQVVGWHWLPMHQSDQDFLPLVELLRADGIGLADLGFRCKAGIPDNLKLCLKGMWNDRMGIETTFSLLTVVCRAKQMFHRTAHHLQARLAYTAAMFNVLIALDRQLHPDDPFRTSIAEFSL
ncbi:MAG TPA: hypothetical protein VHO69_17505 [Phototrophicaceae bacterium]|nr:hypothetical protein [Phototrophicaceae bacterium]